MGMFEVPHVSVTLNLRITDVRAFVRAARKQAIEEGYSPEDAKAEFKATTLGDCAVMLLDPGTSPPGSKIDDSESEVF